MILSLHRRTLFINQFVISKLLFKLSCTSIPDEFPADMQRKLLDYFLNGLHRVSLGILSMPLAEGGQGFPYLGSHFHTVKLQIIQ